VRKEFQDLGKKMYTDVQQFQKIVAQITSLVDIARTKNIDFNGIRETMDEMKKWTEDNPDTPIFLPRMTGREI